MDRRFLTVLGVSLLFALVVSTVFYQVIARGRGRSGASAKMETADLVVAAVPLPIGAQIKSGDVKIAPVPRSRVPAGSFSKAEEVVGRPVVSNILLDEPIVSGRLADKGSGFGLAPVIPKGMRAVAVKVNEVVGVAGFVLPGIRVDVLVTVQPPGDAGARTTTILQNIPVLAAGQHIQPDSSGKAVNVPVVTLLVTPEQAEALTLAGNEGRIQLVLRNSTDLTLANTPGKEMTELYGLRPTPPRVVAKQPAPRLPPVAKEAPAPLPPVEEVLVIRGTQRSTERIGAAAPN